LSSWFWGSGFYVPYFFEGVLRRVCFITCDWGDSSRSRSPVGEDLLGLWPWLRLQSYAATPQWGRHSILGQPAGQVEAEGPSAQHDILEDWELDLKRHWAVSCSGYTEWRKSIWPNFPPHCLW
jgi:hypothetical protein